ncbi:MAG: extracellular solute-binding protein [Rhodobacter sp.]|nr:extracellular solute-binding protein [Rhodobacter sp.]MCA3453521.1 extracellular solute-binding protein [Rhodobacter sp.]MCA3456176.1 extracellular solute-binding protein [Rhodobacter sp.]MCA3461745.1 extracellular solute-binding protein [Rhodobacter sp.]MCA3465371.1 extracellular solute-binding protein [Rhodobacter sp.]
MTFRTCLRAGAAALALVASGAANAEVTVLGWPGGPEEAALRAVTELYNARADLAEENKVELLFTSRDGFFDKLQVDLAAGSTAFDINLIATYSIGRYAPFMDPVTLSDQAGAVFGDTVLKTMQFDGQQYGVPTDLSLHFLYYRTDLIDALLADDAAKAKYSEIAMKHLGKAMEPKAPADWTWEDFVANALYFTQSINPESPTRYGTVIQAKNLLFNMMVFHSWPRSYGGNWMADTGAITVDSEAFRTALSQAKMLFDLGATPPDSTSYEYAEANAAYASGQVAAMVQWNAAAGELTAAQAATGTTAPPAGPDGRFTHIHGLGLGLNKAAENKDGAIAFLQWLSTEEAALAYAKAGGAPGLASETAAKLAADRPDLVQVGEYASTYGFVMNGGTSENALSVYEAQAKEFTGYWAGTQDLDTALKNTAAAMTDLLK